MESKILIEIQRKKIQELSRTQRFFYKIMEAQYLSKKLTAKNLEKTEIEMIKKIRSNKRKNHFPLLSKIIKKVTYQKFDLWNFIIENTQNKKGTTITELHTKVQAQDFYVSRLSLKNAVSNLHAKGKIKINKEKPKVFFILPQGSKAK